MASKSDHKDKNILANSAFGESDSPSIVFLDGIYDPNLSNLSELPDTVIVMNLQDALQVHPEIIKSHLSKTVSYTPIRAHQQTGNRLSRILL